MELFDISLWGAPLALVLAVVVLVWRRWVLPFLLGIVALPLGGLVGRLAWEWFADRGPGFDFGSEFEGFDWVMGFASVGSLVGVVVGVFTSARRHARRQQSSLLTEYRRRR
jgi:hypothetical protein